MILSGSRLGEPSALKQGAPPRRALKVKFRVLVSTSDRRTFCVADPFFLAWASLFLLSGALCNRSHRSLGRGAMYSCVARAGLSGEELCVCDVQLPLISTRPYDAQDAEAGLTTLTNHECNLGSH